MTVIENPAQTTNVKTLPCPDWCVADHKHLDEWKFEQHVRTHFGHTQTLPGSDLGEETVAEVELVRRDDLSTGVASEVGVSAWCDGALTVEQAYRFGQMVFRAHALAAAVRQAGRPTVISRPGGCEGEAWC